MLISESICIFNDLRVLSPSTYKYTIMLMKCQGSSSKRGTGVGEHRQGDGVNGGLRVLAKLIAHELIAGQYIADKEGGEERMAEKVKEVGDEDLSRG